MITVAVYPHPAPKTVRKTVVLRTTYGATSSRKREKGFWQRCTSTLYLDDAYSAPPLPLAGEDWGEGKTLRIPKKPLR
jgi:hypothetical protein